MKWPKSHFNVLDSAFSQFIQNSGLTLEELRCKISNISPMSGMHRLYAMIWGDLMNDDNHPRYKDQTLNDGTVYPGRIRLVKHVPGFELYPSGCNDSHLGTILKKLGKKHGLID